MYEYYELSLTFSDERPGDHDGRGTRVRDPADHHRQAIIRPSSENHRTERSLVFWPTVHRLQRRFDLD